MEKRTRVKFLASILAGTFLGLGSMGCNSSHVFSEKDLLNGFCRGNVCVEDVNRDGKIDLVIGRNQETGRDSIWYYARNSLKDIEKSKYFSMLDSNSTIIPEYLRIDLSKELELYSQRN